MGARDHNNSGPGRRRPAGPPSPAGVVPTNARRGDAADGAAPFTPEREREGKKSVRVRAGYTPRTRMGSRTKPGRRLRRVAVATAEKTDLVRRRYRRRRDATATVRGYAMGTAGRGAFSPPPPPSLAPHC